MSTDDIERIVKLHQSTTNKDIQKLLLQLLAIEVQQRGLIVKPVMQPGGIAMCGGEV